MYNMRHRNLNSKGETQSFVFCGLVQGPMELKTSSWADQLRRGTRSPKILQATYCQVDTPKSTQMKNKIGNFADSCGPEAQQKKLTTQHIWSRLVYIPLKKK
jgi:hypothetical protein